MLRTLHSIPEHLGILQDLFRSLLDDFELAMAVGPSVILALERSIAVLGEMHKETY